VLGVGTLAVERLSVLRIEIDSLRASFDSEQSKLRLCRAGRYCADLCMFLCEERLRLPRAEVLPLQSGQLVDFAPEGFESLSSNLEIELFRNLDDL